MNSSKNGSVRRDVQRLRYLVNYRDINLSDQDSQLCLFSFVGLQESLPRRDQITVHPSPSPSILGTRPPHHILYHASYPSEPLPEHYDCETSSSGASYWGRRCKVHSTVHHCYNMSRCRGSLPHSRRRWRMKVISNCLNLCKHFHPHLL